MRTRGNLLSHLVNAGRQPDEQGLANQEMPDVELDDLPDSSHLSDVLEVQTVTGVTLQAVPGGCGCGLVQHIKTAQLDQTIILAAR